MAVKQCGEEIARLRSARGWSRARLVVRLLRELESDEELCEGLSEAWLARLENGRMVKLPRPTLEALCRALACTERERARLLLLADRNVLCHASAGPDPAAEVLTYAMSQLHDEAGALLQTLIGQRRTADLTDAEVLELVLRAVQIVAQQHPH
jgi:transcriptional regulator with XRE-family HTH domain